MVANDEYNDDDDHPDDDDDDEPFGVDDKIQLLKSCLIYFDLLLELEITVRIDTTRPVLMGKQLMGDAISE